MATCRTLIDTALRKLGVLGSGQAALDSEYEDVLRAIPNIYRQLVNSGTFGEMEDVVVYDDYVAGNNQHIKRMGQYAQRITLPSIMDQNSRVIGNLTVDFTPPDYPQPTNRLPQTNGGLRTEVVPPRDCSLVFISDDVSGGTTRFIFDGTTKQWNNIDEFLLDAEAPLSDRDEAGFVAFIAYLVADEFGKQITPLMMDQMTQFKKNLAFRWVSEERSQPATYY